MSKLMSETLMSPPLKPKRNGSSEQGSASGHARQARVEAAQAVDHGLALAGAPEGAVEVPSRRWCWCRSGRR